MRFLLIIFLTISLSGICQSQNHDIIYTGAPLSKCSSNFEFYKTEQNIDFTQIYQLQDWNHSSSEVSKFGTTQSTIWLKTTLTNRSKDSLVYLEIDNSSLDYCGISFKHDESPFLELGQAFPFSKRPLKSTTLIYPLAISPERTQELYIKIRSNKSINFPINIGPKDFFTDKSSTKLNYLSLFFGIIIALSLFNLFLFLSIGNKNYGYYALFVFFSGFIQLVIMGYADVYIWSENPWLSKRSIPLFASINGVSTLLFFNSLLKFKQTSKFIYKFYLFEICGFCLLFILSIPSETIKFGYNLMNLLSIPALVLVVATIKGIFTQLKIARLIFVALMILVAGMFIFMMKEYSILPYNNFTNLALPVSKIIEFFVLSIAISGHIQNLKKEKEKSDQDKLKLLQTNKNLVERQKEKLKQQVETRTSELRASNEELLTTLKNLKSTQKQLVESEKLASLGQLTAGIAHELNNPINFIAGNVNPLKRDISELLALISLYDEVLNAEKPKYEIEAFKNEIELDYLKEEIEQLLDGISDGSNRTAEIVTSLKLYSHLDKDEFSSGDINNGIESTVVILRSNYRGECTIKLNLDDSLPFVQCQMGKINQVLMNLINNAIQASISQNRDRSERLVEITSQKAGKFVMISIKDNGTGMDEETQNKIFDPFFTTKKQGEGTGLGLSLCKTIIDTHQGLIKLNSEVGKGSEFVLTLPIHLYDKHPITNV